MSRYRAQRAPDGAVIALHVPSRTTTKKDEAEAWAKTESLAKKGERFVVMVETDLGSWEPCSSVRGNDVASIGGK